MTTVYVVTAGSGDTYRIERVYLDRDQAYGFAQDYNGIAPVEPVQVEEWETGAPPGAYDGPYWRAEWWARVPASKRRGQLRHTREGERFDDFDIRQEWWTGEALPEAKLVRRELAGRAQSGGGGPVAGEGRGTILGHDYPGQGRSGGSAREIISTHLCNRTNKMSVAYWTLPLAVRHDRFMDRACVGTARPPHRESGASRWATEPHRPGQQPAVHRAHPLRHRKRRAQGQSRHVRHAGKQARPGHPAASTPSSLGANPKSWWSSCAATAPRRPSTLQTRFRHHPDALSGASTRNCCWSCDAASSGLATDATRPGTTGAMALTRKATGPTRASRAWSSAGPHSCIHCIQIC